MYGAALDTVARLLGVGGSTSCLSRCWASRRGDHECVDALSLSLSISPLVSSRLTRSSLACVRGPSPPRLQRFQPSTSPGSGTADSPSFSSRPPRRPAPLCAGLPSPLAKTKSKHSLCWPPNAHERWVARCPDAEESEKSKNEIYLRCRGKAMGNAEARETCDVLKCPECRFKVGCSGRRPTLASWKDGTENWHGFWNMHGRRFTGGWMDDRVDGG